jgi:hypothetical protein
MSQQYGVKAILPVDAPHVLGMVSARTGSTDLLLDIWNGSSSSARIFSVQKDGYLWAVAGSAANPAYTFEDDPDTGLFSKGANQLGFAVGGAELGYLAAGGLSWGGGSQIGSSSSVSVSGHTHVEADITDLGTYLTVAAAAATYAVIGHDHDSDYAQLSGATFVGDVTIDEAKLRVEDAPAGIVEIIESDATPPAGEWRFVASGDTFTLQRATAAGFSSVQNAMYVGADGDVELCDATIRIGSDDKIGFYSTLPISKPTGVAVTAAGIHAALVSLGLIAA